MFRSNGGIFMESVTDFKGSKEIGDGDSKSGHIRGIMEDIQQSCDLGITG